MKSIHLSTQNSQLKKDPIFGDFIEKSTAIVLAGITQELLAVADPKSYRYKSNPLEFDKNNKVKHQSPGSVIIEHLNLKEGNETKRIVKKMARNALFTKSNKSFIGNHINLKSEQALVTDKALLTKAFHLTPLNLIDHKYIVNMLLRFVADRQESGVKTAKENTKLELYLKQVKCMDETNPERFGSDEIAMGAIFLDADGNESKKNEFMVGRRFDDGDEKNYTPSTKLKSFNLSSSHYPQFYTSFFTLAEKDSGGLSSFINDLYKSIKTYTTKILTTLGTTAGAFIGGKIGGTVGSAIAGPLGTAIGLIAGAILGAVIAALVDAFKDDIFEPQIATIGIPSSTSLFDNDSLTSPWQYLHFRGHGGHYRIKYMWKLVQ